MPELLAPPGGFRLVVLDNYDSFVWNLVQLLGERTGAVAQVLRCDRVRVAEIAAQDPTHVVISPGPGTPEDPAYFGVGLEVIRALGPRVPILGVCLGHQGIGAAFGARIVGAPSVMHGKTSAIYHGGVGLFAGLPSPLTAMRYHSLVVDEATLPAELAVTARTADGLVMGLEHRCWPIVGVQFHPESIATECGAALVSNFLAMRRSAAA